MHQNKNSIVDSTKEAERKKETRKAKEAIEKNHGIVYFLFAQPIFWHKTIQEVFSVLCEWDIECVRFFRSLLLFRMFDDVFLSFAHYRELNDHTCTLHIYIVRCWRINNHTSVDTHMTSNAGWLGKDIPHFSAQFAFHSCFVTMCVSSAQTFRYTLLHTH